MLAEPGQSETRAPETGSEQCNDQEHEDRPSCYQIMKKLFFSLVLGTIVAICWVMIIHTLKWIAIKGNEFEMLNQQQQQQAAGQPAQPQQPHQHHNPNHPQQQPHQQHSQQTQQSHHLHHRSSSAALPPVLLLEQQLKHLDAPAPADAGLLEWRRSPLSAGPMARLDGGAGDAKLVPPQKLNRPPEVERRRDKMRSRRAASEGADNGADDDDSNDNEPPQTPGGRLQSRRLAHLGSIAPQAQQLSTLGPAMVPDFSATNYQEEPLKSEPILPNESSADPSRLDSFNSDWPSNPVGDNGLPPDAGALERATPLQAFAYKAPFFTSWFVSIWNILFMPVFALISSCCFRSEDTTTKKQLV